MLEVQGGKEVLKSQEFLKFTIAYVGARKGLRPADGYVVCFCSKTGRRLELKRGNN